jgi:predicted ATP-dependent protease
VAVTGDLCLSGEIRAVDGLEAKARAAQKAGNIDMIAIPAANYDKVLTVKALAGESNVLRDIIVASSLCLAD